MFVLGVAMPREAGPSLTAAMSLTTFGVVWIGMAIGIASCCASCPTAAGSSSRS